MINLQKQSIKDNSNHKILSEFRKICDKVYNPNGNKFKIDNS